MRQLGTSKSTISRRFVVAMRKALGDLMARPLDGLNLAALFIDGIVVAGRTVAAAMGLDLSDHKHILGIWEGATETRSCASRRFPASRAGVCG